MTRQSTQTTPKKATCLLEKYLSSISDNNPQPNSTSQYPYNVIFLGQGIERRLPSTSTPERFTGTPVTINVLCDERGKVVREFVHCQVGRLAFMQLDDPLSEEEVIGRVIQAHRKYDGGILPQEEKARIAYIQSVVIKMKDRGLFHNGELTHFQTGLDGIHIDVRKRDLDERTFRVNFKGLGPGIIYDMHVDGHGQEFYIVDLDRPYTAVDKKPYSIVAVPKSRALPLASDLQFVNIGHANDCPRRKEDCC